MITGRLRPMYGGKLVVGYVSGGIGASKRGYLYLPPMSHLFFLDILVPCS